MKFKAIILLLVLGVFLTPIVAGQAGTTADLCYVAPGGDDGNDCSSEGDACETINAALGEPGCGSTIKVASGTYTGTGSDPVVSITRSIALSGGWDETFTEQIGTSTIDGEDARRGIGVNSDLLLLLSSSPLSEEKGMVQPEYPILGP